MTSLANIVVVLQIQCTLQEKKKKILHFILVVISLTAHPIMLSYVQSSRLRRLPCRSRPAGACSRHHPGKSCKAPRWCLRSAEPGSSPSGGYRELRLCHTHKTKRDAKTTIQHRRWTVINCPRVCSYLRRLSENNSNFYNRITCPDILPDQTCTVYIV